VKPTCWNPHSTRDRVTILRPEKTKQIRKGKNELNSWIQSKTRI